MVWGGLRWFAVVCGISTVRPMGIVTDLKMTLLDELGDCVVIFHILCEFIMFRPE